MATWIGVIVATDGRADFWTVAAEHGVRARIATVPAHVLIVWNAWGDFFGSLRLAEELSRALETKAIGFAIQTTVDTHFTHAFERGTRVRRLEYAHEQDGWLSVEGEVQDWERAYFFEGTTVDGGTWPDLRDSEATDADAARYEAAKRSGDATSVLSLLSPSSTWPMFRVCQSLGIEPDEPAGFWKKPSLWSRLFGRTNKPRT